MLHLHYLVIVHTRPVVDDLEVVVAAADARRSRLVLGHMDWRCPAVVRMGFQRIDCICRFVAHCSDHFAVRMGSSHNRRRCRNLRRIAMNENFTSASCCQRAVVPINLDQDH